ncbi:membrane protein of unknown function [Blastococcus saxobsidens DD2]|uniref:Uncharacterized protein n=1 Tax=Blastococcus saxobsidens (strain DD2) TaxID=1146883 RepID=H6RVF6_BLASD|nr:membrane protein of unknown function [Blastococcus saxobsidens DD2]
MWEQLLTVVVTALVGAAVSRGLPTLRRRLREHVALLKDLPDELRPPVVELVRGELLELVELEEGRRSRQIDYAWAGATMLSLAVLVGGLVAAVLTSGEPGASILLSGLAGLGLGSLTQTAPRFYIRVKGSEPLGRLDDRGPRDAGAD